jgi:hypothetical protein
MGGGDYFFVVVTVRGIRSYKTIFGREWQLNAAFDFLEFRLSTILTLTLL